VKRIVGVLAAVAAAAAVTQASVAAASGAAAKLQLRKTHVGTILVNGQGRTIYAFTKDRRNRDACVSIQGCRNVWPLVTTSGKPVAGRGVRTRLLGTITIGHGVRQVTYAGHPLYTYVADSGPGDTFYVNFAQFGGRWPALNAAGNEVK
jgi:predicted lipoprotein with Yx(FWY)xxD motif